MLVLSRYPGQRIMLNNDIVITLVECRGNKAKIGIEAPDNYLILREELIGKKPKGERNGRPTADESDSGA